MMSSGLAVLRVSLFSINVDTLFPNLLHLAERLDALSPQRRAPEQNVVCRLALPVQ